MWDTRDDRLYDESFDGVYLAGSAQYLDRPRIALVGTRAPSDLARRRARCLGEQLARAGVCIVTRSPLG